jgi:hypothetical protein
MLDRALSKTALTLEKPTSEQHSLLVGRNRYPESTYLPLNAEKRMTTAVIFASSISAPIQTMLTINAAHIQRMGSDSVFDVGHLWDGFRRVLELIRKWLVERGISWACVWVREYTGGRNEHHGEHWHIALHVPPRYQNDLAAQVAIWAAEAVGVHDGKKKCIARSLTGAWYLSRRKDNVGEYLGKATPKTRLRYGHKIKNGLRTTNKHGGEGPIQGKRYGISNTIGHTAQLSQPAIALTDATQATTAPHNKHRKAQ